MCKSHNPRVIDKCMREAVRALQNIFNCTGSGLMIRACCCGHGKYPTSLIYENADEYVQELFSGMMIPRKRKFYKRDKKGYYYVPEVIKV